MADDVQSADDSAPPVDPKIVEKGFQQMLVAIGNASAPEEQIAALRTVFFLGAQHAFAVLSPLIDGSETSDEDLAEHCNNADSVELELEEFLAQIHATVQAANKTE